MTSIKKTTRYVVIAQYAYADKERGDIISQHRTRQAAERAARNNSFAAIRNVRDQETTAHA